MSGLFDSFDLSAVTKPAQAKKAKKAEEIKKEKSKGRELTNQGLFSDEFNIELNRPQVNVLLDKLSKSGDATGADAAKVLKSKSLTLEEKLEVIRAKVLEVLGRQRKNVVVIKTKKEFEDYVSRAIEFGRIAIDTETNNSTERLYEGRRSRFNKFIFEADENTENDNTTSNDPLMVQYVSLFFL